MWLQVFTSRNASGAFHSRQPVWSGCDVIYAAASIVAASLTLISLLASLYGGSASEPVLPLDALILAATIWLAGYVCRLLLKGS